MLDVIPPPSISFVQTLVTVRSDLDPFLLVEALTYESSGGGGGAGGGSNGGGGGGIAGDVDVGGTTMSAGAGDGRRGVAFGLSSESCAAVGFTFLAIGLLLLVQPMFAVRKWWRDAGGGVVGRRENRAGEGRGDDRGGDAGRRAVGQWRYGQVGTEW